MQWAIRLKSSNADGRQMSGRDWEYFGECAGKDYNKVIFAKLYRKMKPDVRMRTTRREEKSNNGS